jgi:hypothetical protein
MTSPRGDLATGASTAVSRSRTAAVRRRWLYAANFMEAQRAPAKKWSSGAAPRGSAFWPNHPAVHADTLGMDNVRYLSVA